MLPSTAVSAPKTNNGNGPVRFAVLSDLHFYDAKLGTEGVDFDNYLARDCKMLHLAEPILQAALTGILAENVRFVIVTGDLTKDGEVLNHVRVSQYFEKLRQAGIAVYVVPGNHDMNNNDAVEYGAKKTKPVPTANAAVFRAMYERFGYGQAIDRAPDSLSYLAEPAPGLWLLALDSAKWAESAGSEVPAVSGRLSAATMEWALQKLTAAGSAGKKVIAFMHHGVNPHFLGEPAVFPDYLVDNFAVVGAQFAAAGLKVIFTGHNHGHDASFINFNADGNPVPTSLCDIETGSLASYPCPYRIAELDSGGVLHVSSRRVNQVDADLGGSSFAEYALLFAQQMLPYPIKAQLQQQFGLSKEDADDLAPLVVQGLLSYYNGDESLAAMPPIVAVMIGQPEPMHTLGMLLYTFWYDVPPGDNTLNVSL